VVLSLGQKRFFLAVAKRKFSQQWLGL